MRFSKEESVNALWFIWAVACTFDVPPDVRVNQSQPGNEVGDSGTVDPTDDTGSGDDGTASPIEIPRPSEDLAIAGTWHATPTASIAYTATQAVTTWSSEPRAIATHNNDQRWLIHSDGAHMSDDGARVDWYIDAAGHLRTCEHPAVDTVGALMVADDADPGPDGCFGGPWATARPDLPITGTYSQYEWLYSFDPFTVTDLWFEEEYDVLAQWAGEPWLITQPLWYSETADPWLIEWREYGTGYWMCPLATDGVTDWSALRAKVDDSDWDIGCDDAGWWEFRQPFAARGPHEPLGSNIPHNLYEWYSDAFDRTSGESVLWAVHTVENNGTTMVMSTTNDGVARDERHIKIQVAMDAEGQWSLCLLAAEVDLATAAAAAPIVPLADSQCTKAALGSPPGWKPLVPTGG